MTRELRLIHKTPRIDGKQIKVYRSAATDEYIVRFYANGIHMDASDYFTTDKQDALDTATYAMHEYLRQ
jgi:hypothetical protein